MYTFGLFIFFEVFTVLVTCYPLVQSALFAHLNHLKVEVTYPRAFKSGSLPRPAESLSFSISKLFLSPTRSSFSFSRFVRVSLSLAAFLMPCSFSDSSCSA